MTLDEFLRIYKVRAANLAWFLGAGASAASGIPTAVDLIWQFKRTLFCASQRASVKSCEDLQNSVVQKRLDSYFQSLGTFPAEGAPEEYAAYFEATYADPSDRRAVLDTFLAGVKPSYGHLALAALMQTHKARIVWTPNFDKLIEDASFQMLGSASAFVVASLDNSAIALQAMNEGRWPLIGKLHGDFQSRRLKNTSDELRNQDIEIRRALLESCRRNGLVVIGYSGRDRSVLEILQQAIEEGRGYPAGLFWLYRGGSPILPSVGRLIESARKSGIQAEIIEIQTFDEVLADVVRQFDDIPTEIAEKLDRHHSRLSEIPLEPPGRGWPVIRLNALPVTNWPTMCRRIDCAVGGTREVREIVKAEKVDAIATRSRLGVLAFGNDDGLRRAFTRFEIKEFGCHSIETSRLHVESTELGLLREALARALQRSYPLTAQRVHSSYILIPDSLRASGRDFAYLQDCVGQLGGVIPHTTVEWSEALAIKLDYKLGRMWLVVEPTVHFGKPSSRQERFSCADFVRERLATRYNRQWNSLIEAWIFVLMNDRQDSDLRAFGDNDGIDAHFTLNRITAFTRRAAPIS